MTKSNKAAGDKLSAASSEAADILLALMRNPDAPSEVRLAAAPVSSGPLLAQSQVGMLTSNSAATPEATTDPHSVLGYLGAWSWR